MTCIGRTNIEKHPSDSQEIPQLLESEYSFCVCRSPAMGPCAKPDCIKDCNIECIELETVIMESIMP